jgi:hypothetical protein
VIGGASALISALAQKLYLEELKTETEAEYKSRQSSAMQGRS